MYLENGRFLLFFFRLKTSPHIFGCGCAERVEVCGSDAEADQSGEAARAVQDRTGAGDSELQGGGDQAAQDHLPARERTRPVHQ